MVMRAEPPAPAAAAAKPAAIIDNSKSKVLQSMIEFHFKLQPEFLKSITAQNGKNSF